MQWNKKFNYPPSVRSLIDNQRHYDIYGDMPSATTILSATVAEKKASLLKWKQKVGNNEADRIRDDAAARVRLCTGLSRGVTGDGHQDLSDMGQAAGIGPNCVQAGSKGLYGRNMGV